MTEASVHRWRFLLLVAGSALFLLPSTMAVALISLPLAAGITVSIAAAASHAALLALRRAPTIALLAITATTAVQALVTGLFVLLPSTALVLVALHGASARGDRRVAIAAAVLGPVAAAFRYAADPAIVGGGFGPAPWLLAVLLLAVCAVAVATGTLRRSELRVTRLIATQLELEERDRAHREEAAAAAERARISRDLHDVLAHSLTVIVGQARVARFDPDGAEGALDVIEDTARESLRDLRVTLRTLRGGGPEADLHRPPTLADLPGLAARMQDLGLQVRRRTIGTPRALGPAAESAMHRFVQEGLTNALRHGEGVLDWEQRWCEDRIMIRLHNAVPSPPRSTPGSGWGLSGMRERLESVGGSLRIERTTGFAVCASVPYPSQAVADARDAL